MRVQIVSAWVVGLLLLALSPLWGQEPKPPTYYAETDSYRVNSRLIYITAFAHAQNDVVFAKGGWFGWKFIENGRERVTWKFRADCNSLRDMYFKNENEGWLFSDCGGIYQTKDAGRTWKKMSETKYIAGRYMELYAMTDEIIFLSNVTEYLYSTINILITRNAGLTWKVLTREDILNHFGLTEDEYKGFDWVLGKDIRTHVEKTPNQDVGIDSGVPGDPTNLIPGSFEWDPDEWRRKHPGLPDPPPGKRNLPPDQYPGPGTPSPKAVPEVPPSIPVKPPEAATPSR